MVNKMALSEHELCLELSKVTSEKHKLINELNDHIRICVSKERMINELLETLEYYADPCNWLPRGFDYGNCVISRSDREDLSENDTVELYGGKRARETIKYIKERRAK